MNVKKSKFRDGFKFFNIIYYAIDRLLLFLFYF